MVGFPILRARSARLCSPLTLFSKAHLPNLDSPPASPTPSEGSTDSGQESKNPPAPPPNTAGAWGGKAGRGSEEGMEERRLERKISASQSARLNERSEGIGFMRSSFGSFKEVDKEGGREGR